MSVDTGSLSSRILLCGAFALSLAIMPARAEPASPAGTEQAAQPGSGMLCTDDMETEPLYDEDEAIPVADIVDGGCLVNRDAISI